MVILLFRSVVQLFQDSFQFRRDGQTEVGGVLKQGYALIGQIEEYHGSTKHADAAEHLHVQQMANADKRKNEYLTKDALKADVGR